MCKWTINGRVKIATRVAVDHEGRVLGGRILEKGVKEDNYIAELAAQLDALTDAAARGPEERVIIARHPCELRASCPRLARRLLAHFGDKFGEMKVVVSSQEEELLGGADIRAGSAIWAGGRWFARSECLPTWWHFQFECMGEPRSWRRARPMR
jgi:hypothetical protein